MSYWAYNDPFCAYSAKPGTYAGGKTVNRHGFISTPDIHSSKPDSVTRIVFLGGSSAAGTGITLKDEDTWPWRVNELLKKEGYITDFINGALGGYTTFESFGLLFSRLRFFNPDVVVVYHGWNDSYYFSSTSGKMHKWRENDDGSYTINFKVHYESVAPLWIDRFIAWSCLLTELRLYFIHEPGRGELFSEEELQQIEESKFDKKRVKVYRDNLAMIKAFCEIMDYKLFVCKQPTLLPLHKTDSLKFHFAEHGFDVPTQLETFDSIYAVIDKNYTPDQIIDVTSVSYNTENFHDQVHPSATGTSVIARIVTDSLINNYFKTPEYEYPKSIAATR